MGVKLNAASGGGSVELDVPNSVSSDVVLTLPDNDGSANQVLQTDGSGALSWAANTNSQISTRASVADQNVTAINFENLPTDTCKIQVNWWEVGAASYTANEDHRIIVQLGTTSSHTYKTSGYNLSSSNVSTSSATSLGLHDVNYAGVSFYLWVNNEQENGHVIFTKVGGNRWVFAGQSQMSSGSGWQTTCMGSFDLGADVTCARITTKGGTATLPNGNSSVMTWSAP